MSIQHKKGIFLAFLAAALYAINSPFSKLLLGYIPPVLMAGLLYIGAGLGMTMIVLYRKATKRNVSEMKLTKKELPFTLGMIILDILAPIFLMIGLTRASAANASLLNNFEIVATSVIALTVFHEKISPRLWLGILAVTLSCMILSFENASSLSFSSGSIFVLLAACCWGLENNCTRMLSSKDPLEIVFLKGIFSGGFSVLIGLLNGERITVLWCIPLVLLLGFVAYGLSIYTYVYAQRILGASRTSAYYAVAPFIGVFLSLLIFHEIPGPAFLIALIFMSVGAFLSACDTPLKIVFFQFALKNRFLKKYI